MSPTRTDDDLERLLRATLSTHARTVEYGPAWNAPADVDRRRSGVNRRRVPAAVAAVLVLALVATLAVFHLRGQKPQPSAPAGPPRSSFTTFDVPGYRVTSRETLGDGARSVTVRTPGGEASGDVVVTLWAPHAYTFARLGHQVVVQVSGHRGFAGTAGTEQYHNHDRPIHAVVWQFARDQWAVAQQLGDIERVPSAAAILAVARATRPGQHRHLTTPFRLDALPAGYRLDQVIVPSSSHVVFLLLHARRDRSLEFVAEPTDTRRAGTEPGAVVVRHSGVTVSIFAIGPHGRPGADRALARQSGQHIVWGTTDLSRVVP